MFVGTKGKIVILFLTVGAVYFIYENLRKRLTSLQVPENANPLFSEELHIGRKLLAHGPIVNEKLLELEPDKNPLNKEKSNEENLQEISKNFISHKNIGRNRMKKLNRRKRNTHHTDFGWRLSLNVTNNKSPPKGVSKLASQDELISKSGKEKFLNIAVQMEAASPDDNSFKELHQAWDSLGLLLRRMYGKNASLKVNARDITIETSAEQDDKLTTDTPTEKPERQRTPKFLFGLINFGSTENPQLEEVGTVPGIDNSSESVTSPKTNVDLKEEPISTEVPLSTNSSEVPMEAFGLPGQTSVESTVVPITDTFIDLGSTSPEFNTQSVEKFERTSDGPNNDIEIPIVPIEITTLKPERSLTSEQLKAFCISLLSRIHVSPKSIDQFSEENGSGELDVMGIEDKETMTEFQTLSTDVPKESTTKSTNQRFGLWASIWNRFVGRRLIQHSIDVSMQPPTLTPKHDVTLEKAIDDTNDALRSNVESSTTLGISVSTDPDQDFFNEEDGSALTIPDCENFFRQMQNDAVFSKPNLLDIINNPILLSLDPLQFNFTEEIDDKQERSMRSGSDSTDSNFENDILTPKEIADELNTPFSAAKTTVKELPNDSFMNDLLSEHPDENLVQVTVSNHDFLPTPSDNKDSFQSGTFDKFNIDNLITENSKDFSEVATEISILSDRFPEKQTQASTEILEGIFIQFDNHVETDKPSEVQSSEVSVDIDGRIFGLLNFGSGERSLDDSDSLSTPNASEFSETRSFHPDPTNFESGNTELNEVFSEGGLETSSDTITRPNIFDFILNLRKEESLINSTESVAFDINDITQSIEDANTVPSTEKSQMEFQLDSNEKTTENQELSSMFATQSISDQMPLHNIPDEKSHTEFQLNPEEQFNESQNGALDSTISATKSLLEDQTSFQIVLDDGSGDEGSRIIPGLFNFFGSGDGRELSESPLNPEFNSESSECLDCLKNTSSSFSFDDYDDCGSDINDTIPLMGEKITTMNPLPDEIVSDAHVEDDGIDINNEVNPLSESNQDQPQLSTDHFLKSIVSTPVAESVYYEDLGSSENTGYEVTNYENYDDFENEGHEVPNYEDYENYDYDITTFQPLEHIHIEGECNETHSDTEANAFSASPTEAITSPEENLRFMDTLFLTGSGAGGLFGNDDGEINLVQEPDTTSFPSLLSPATPRQSRRGGRRDDVPFFAWSTENQDQVSEKQSDFTHSSSLSDNPELKFHDSAINEKALQPPVGEEKVDTSSNLDSFESINDEFESSKADDDKTQIFHVASSATVTVVSSVTSSVDIPKKKTKDWPPRYCNNAGECNIALNEGCITKRGHSVCDCRRSFVRHPETDICEAPFMMRTSLKLPGEEFHEDLRDKYSELYQNKTRDAVDTMWLVVYEDPTLVYNVADIIVTGFEKGSLVIHWELIFAAKKNGSILEVVERLEETFKHRNVIESAPLNVENAKLMSFGDINSCEKKELNYCSPNADCIRGGNRGFRCRCKEGYLDNSKYPMYPGEICIVTCPLDYCGENGYCEVRSNDQIQCLCNGWYFGEKCDISGILVVSCFAGANVIIIIFVLSAVFLVKRRRQRRTRFYENNQVMFQSNQEAGPFGRVSPRLAASIALDEMGSTKPSKYMAISTPLYMKPDIQITSPSIMGSSISYDYDSTFDRTPSAEVNMEPPKYDSIPEVPKYDSVPQV